MAMSFGGDAFDDGSFDSGSVGTNSVASFLEKYTAAPPVIKTYAAAAPPTRPTRSRGSPRKAAVRAPVLDARPQTQEEALSARAKLVRGEVLRRVRDSIMMRSDMGAERGEHLFQARRTHV